MKRFIPVLGVLFMLQSQLFCQETQEFLLKKDFQSEKSQLLKSIYSLNKTNKELNNMLLFEVKANDSLAELVELQSVEIQVQKEFLQTLDVAQTDLDSRLLTQRKSGTLIAILVPIVLFMLILIVLIWFIIFRHRMLSMFNHLNDRWNELSKRLDDQESKYKQEQGAIRAELQTSGKEIKNNLQKFAIETEEKLQNLENLVKEEQASHDVKHDQTHKEFEVFKGSLQKGYDALTSDLSGLKEELSSTARELTSKLKKIIKQNPD